MYASHAWKSENKYKIPSLEKNYLQCLKSADFANGNINKCSKSCSRLLKEVEEEKDSQESSKKGAQGIST